MPHKYRDTASTVPVRFDPTDRENALSAFCARAVLMDGYGEDSPTKGSKRLLAAVEELAARGVPVRPEAYMVLASRYTADGDEKEWTAADLLSFERRFAGVGPTLALGALLTDGLYAPRLPVAGPHVDEVALRLLESGDQERDLGLDLANMATLYLRDGEVSLIGAMDILTLPPRDTARPMIRQLAIPHIRWCLTAYQAARQM